ncbi:putative chromatin regulator PHD family [Helianthus annuus]|nr:zinc finger CCCH domain-containing protein 19 [Helianthus annuus]KAJ0428473.1 putative chromatin regulator PHD family [Helianthus annuus]KAJ0432568.1 putative chromatin regulator PHD family [Helianthus annuus]KAJ0446813.1 putative chromatin regulator PHD family [Helianthus annuus]KAJ0631706.1 putative chromatin regulator PHD family [Helianthus annuus]KAJ0635617.1 putative chromatin regulator PHD family [Helianthus annuus]
MEIGEENTENHLIDSTTTVSTEVLIENDTVNDNNLEKVVSESNIQDLKGEEKESFVTVPESDDSKPVLTAAVEETAAETVEEEVEDGAAGDEISTVDVIAEDDNELIAVEEDINNGENNNNINVSDETETVKMEEEVMTDVKSDTQTENVETVQGDEEITEGQDDVDEEKPVGVTEVDDEGEPVEADEDKLVDTDVESDEEKAGAESPEQSVKTRGCRGKKRKRGGKTPQATPKSSGGGRKTVEEEDVCFMCYDGGDLVICDKRNCPKAYHPACINREEAFFQTKGRWNCGWHLCSNCSKNAEYMCYTCTFSLCKSCIKTDVILCVREKEKKGFCESCMNMVMLIEKNSQENQGNIDFNDKNSWEYLFKDYWTDMKAKLDLSLSELAEAKNPYKGSKPAGKQVLPAGHSDGDSGSENPSENLESQTRKTRSRKSKKPKTRGSAAGASDGVQWASKELLEFVTHMGNDTSYQSQFDVQALLLEYIKTNKLRDSRRKSQIICDARLQGLFGKPRVGHFEMLKLLESHFLIKEDDNNQGSVVDTETSPLDDEKTKDKKRKNRKKGDQELQSNRDDYAAIDIHNINLTYIKRKLAEDLLDDTESFHSKIVGAFVRIRISGANPNQDLYRLVQVTGTTTGAQYAVGKKKTDIMLEILNLNKAESVSIDTISNQDFTEDECKRLRQSIKCGFINRLTVGDVLDKAIELQATRVNDWLETEVVRLSHLRDRASDLGRKKELRECVEKLEVLKTPEERARRLQDIPVIHDDPTMDPNHESEDDTNENDKKQDMYNSSGGSRFSKRRDYPSKESWRGNGTGTGTSRNSGKSYEFSRSLSSNDFSKKVEDPVTSPRMGLLHNDNIRDEGRDRVVQPPPSALRKPSSASETEKNVSSTKDGASETEKIWHYKDPSGKIQGPFSMAQLRKWNNNKFFPVDLRIWRTSEKEKDGILLTDALEGRFTVKVEKHGFANLPSPTPIQSLGHVGPTVGPSSYHEGLQSPTPNGTTQLAASMVAGGNNEPNAMVHTLAGQNAYGWSGGAPLQTQVTQQPNQWAAVQNPAGNFLQQPPQPNVSWPAVPPNPNMGLVGPTTGNQPMNWGTVNVNPSWGPGNVGNVNPGWVPPQPVLAVAPNQAWVGGPGPGPTQAPIVSGTGNPGEVASAGNSNWGSPRPRNGSRWDGNEPYNRGRGGGSGFNSNRRHWEKQGSFNNRGR